MLAQKRLERLLRHYEHCKITKEELRRLLETGVLKGTTGIVGPFVIRYQNGKLVISERAFYYNQSTSEASVDGRKNFAKKVKFAQLLNNIEEVKQIWAKADLDGRLAWNRLIKYNDIKSEHPTTANTITPASHHFAINNICTFTEDFQLNINAKLKENDKLVVVISVYDPKNEADNSFEILRVEGNELNAEQINIYRKYRKYIIYSAVIRGDEWSNTTVVEGTIKTDEKKYSEENEFYLLFIQRNLTPEGTRRVQRKINPILRLTSAHWGNHSP